MNNNYLLVDFGGTKTLLVLMNNRGQIITQDKIATKPHDSGKETIDWLLTMVKSFLSKNNLTSRDLVGTGFCVAGYFNHKTGMLINSPNIKGLLNFPLKEYIGNNLDTNRIVIENDANAAAWGEYVYYKNKTKIENMLYLTVSTGIGGGIIADNNLITGENGYAAEIGHIPILRNQGPVCGCGRMGCLETLASGTAIANRAKEIFNHDPSYFPGLEKAQLSSEKVVELAKKGNIMAQKILLDSIKYLAQGISSVVNILNPGLIVVGGGVANAGNIFLVPLRSYVKKIALKPAVEGLKLVPANHINYSGIYGIYELLKKS